MDWTKAKTILIVAFIGTNLFLAAVLLRDTARQAPLFVDEIFIQQTLDFLEEKGLVLEVELPSSIPSLPTLTVQYQFFPHETTAYRFLGSGWQQLEENTYRNQGRQLTIINNKKVILHLLEPENPLPNMRENTITDASQAFLQSLGLYPEGLRLAQIYVGMVPEYHQEPLHKLVYEQTYLGRFVGESYVHVYLNQQGIVAVEALLLQVVSEGNQIAPPRAMISAAEALLRKLDDILLDQRHQLPVRVSRMEAGNYFPLTSDSLATWETVAAGTAVPAWKIVLRSGDTFYQEAF